MKRRLTILTLTALAVVAFIGVVWTAPSPALAGGATQISGVAFFDEDDVCDSGSMGADFALLMTCQSSFPGTLPTKCLPSIVVNAASVALPLNLGGRVVRSRE